MTSLLARCVGLTTIALLSAACGGATDASAFDDKGDASTSDETSTGADTSVTPGTDTAKDPPPKKDSDVPGDTTPPPPDTASTLTLDNVCARIADITCTGTYGTCCSAKSIPYKESGCRAAVLASCGDQVDAISGGKGTFNPAAFPACASAWSSLASKCSVPILEYLRTYAPCNQLLNGGTAPGGSCNNDWECKVPAGAYANCNNDGRCETIVIAPKDAMCNYGGSTRAFCDYGLSCSFMSGGASGTCRTAKAVGVACNNSFECGFGNWCDKGSFGGTSGKCAVGLAAGASCFGNEQCASSGCSGGKCTDPNATPAISVLCNGTGG